mgnify:FL=1
MCWWWCNKDIELVVLDGLCWIANHLADQECCLVRCLLLSMMLLVFLCFCACPQGETPSEVAALVSVMRKHMNVVDGGPTPCLDIVGTGGDGHHTVNFSTAAAVVAAACGVRVAKHGNRSVSSKSGSADVLEALGVVMLAPEHIAPCLDQCGIAFMFAPKFHPAMKWVRGCMYTGIYSDLQ